MPSPTQKWGFDLEDEAAAFLVQNRYRIVRRNFRGGGSEIDLIAWDGDVLCFIEVRARRSLRFGDPAETVSRAKQRHLVRAAKAYLMRAARMPMVRFDVVSVVAPPHGPRRFVLFRNAFQVDE